MDSLFMVCPPDILNTMTTVNYAISTLVTWFSCVFFTFLHFQLSAMINADTDILANS